MSYFSRLSDIVTCNLSEILSHASDPLAAVQEILAEMEEGLAGARRSVAAAAASQERLGHELDDYRGQVEDWATRARQELLDGNDEQARLSLMRKQEIEDVVAGLEQQLNAAAATCKHLTTTLRALEARQAEAQRKCEELRSGTAAEAAACAETPAAVAGESIPTTRAQQVEAELQALKRELGRQS